RRRGDTETRGIASVCLLAPQLLPGSNERGEQPKSNGQADRVSDGVIANQKVIEGLPLRSFQRSDNLHRVVGDVHHTSQDVRQKRQQDEDYEWMLPCRARDWPGGR